VAGEKEGYWLTVDLEAQRVSGPDGLNYRFEIDAHRKHRLLLGLDDIGASLEHADEIRAYEQRRRAEAPWLFEDLAV
jgi:3-isopropylmalate/(R)-2-methylmalate dehydratase small subunit